MLYNNIIDKLIAVLTDLFMQPDADYSTLKKILMLVSKLHNDVYYYFVNCLDLSHTHHIAYN